MPSAEPAESPQLPVAHRFVRRRAVLFAMRDAQGAGAPPRFYAPYSRRAPDHDAENTVAGGGLDEFVAGRLAERGEIERRQRVGGQDLEEAAQRHVADRLARFEDRQWAVEPAY